mmetsp:Transcript_17016/g.33893  ORF Transcript_17016/g.33893 Transcript_17016/m.33893 type:complete len:100 (-) Transcript_17016:296-595(-)
MPSEFLVNLFCRFWFPWIFQSVFFLFGLVRRFVCTLHEKGKSAVSPNFRMRFSQSLRVSGPVRRFCKAMMLERRSVGKIDFYNYFAQLFRTLINVVQLE